MKSFLALSFLVLLTACGSKDSSSGGGGGSSPVKQQGGSEMTKQPWCMNFQQNNKNYQQRLAFYDDNTFTNHYYNLNNDYSRGADAGSGKGQWELNGNILKIDVQGQKSEYSIRLDPESPTGAPQLHLTSNDGTATFDPCK